MFLVCMQLCQMCQEHDDIVLLKVDWDQNTAIARPLAVKVSLISAHFLQMASVHVISQQVLGSVPVVPFTTQEPSSVNAKGKNNMA